MSDRGASARTTASELLAERPPSVQPQPPPLVSLCAPLCAPAPPEPEAPPFVPLASSNGDAAAAAPASLEPPALAASTIVVAPAPPEPVASRWPAVPPDAPD